MLQNDFLTNFTTLTLDCVTALPDKFLNFSGTFYDFIISYHD